MKKKIRELIRELIKNPSHENLCAFKRTLKDEVYIMQYNREFPPKYYAYKWMANYTYTMELWGDIFSKDILDQEIEVKEMKYRPNSYNITEEDKQEIRKCFFADCMPIKQICDKFKISRTRIIKILKEKDKDAETK